MFERLKRLFTASDASGGSYARDANFAVRQTGKGYGVGIGSGGVFNTNTGLGSSADLTARTYYQPTLIVSPSPNGDDIC